MVWGSRFLRGGRRPGAVAEGDVKEEEFSGESVGGDLGFTEEVDALFRAVRTLRDWDCGEGIGIDLRREFNSEALRTQRDRRKERPKSNRQECLCHRKAGAEDV